MRSEFPKIQCQDEKWVSCLEDHQTCKSSPLGAFEEDLEGDLVQQELCSSSLDNCQQGPMASGSSQLAAGKGNFIFDVQYTCRAGLQPATSSCDRN